MDFLVTNGRKIVNSKPPEIGDWFYKKNSTKHIKAYFQTPQKILKFVTFRVTRCLVELKMVISKQFELFNLKKEKKKESYGTIKSEGSK
jgi:hypothetical protein